MQASGLMCARTALNSEAPILVPFFAADHRFASTSEEPKRKLAAGEEKQGRGRERCVYSHAMWIEPAHAS